MSSLTNLVKESQEQAAAPASSASNTIHELRTPLKPEDIRKLKKGDIVLLSGQMYTARDAAHKLMVQCLNDGKELPIELDGQVIYYTGPTPSKPGQVIGSAGPTSSYRMDAYTPALLPFGLRAMIGKGERSPEVMDELAKNDAVYLLAIGGTGALISQCIKKAEIVAYPELGPEAIHLLEVEKMRLIVA